MNLADIALKVNNWQHSLKMYFANILLLLSASVALSYAQNLTDCVFSLKRNIPKRPLVLKPQEKLEFFYPNEKDQIHIKKGENIRLSCVDQYFKHKFFQLDRELELTCVKRDLVQAKNKVVKFNQLECERNPSSTVQRINGTCDGNHVGVRVGFNVSKQFLELYTACFDSSNKNSVYTKYNSSMLHMGHQSGVKRPTRFEEDGLFGFKVWEKYTRKNVRKTFKKILGSHELSQKYIKDDDNYFLSRGHLTPKADFVYGAEQAATFRYANVAPQWQIFNGGNWQKLEDAVRKILEKDGQRYAIATGTHGIATLPDVNNVEKELYLHVDENNNYQVAVPKYYWKIIYNKKSASGVAVVGINNPYIEKVSKSDVLCGNNNCKYVKWVNWNITDTAQGYMYCCQMKSFLKATGHKNMFL